MVQSFEELPEHIRQFYGEVSSRLEGVYDPASGTVYLVADNLRGTARAAEVWMHENMVHHGLNGLLGKDEKRRVLNRLWRGMGGMGNAEIASVANKYGVDPRSDAEGRALVMEEVVAHLAEKRAAYKLSGQELTYWRRVVEAVLRAWHALVDAVTGRIGSMKYENVDRLLSALDRYVFEGRPESMAEGGMVPVMASKRSDPNNARFSPDTGKKTDFVTLPDGSVDFAQFPATRLKDMRLLRAAPIRLPRGIHSLSGGYGLTHIEANHGNEIRAAGYGSVQEFVWDLVNGYNEIWEGEKRSLLILKNNGKTSRPAGFIELEKDGSHYIVKNAYPVDMNYPTAATRKQLWKSAPPSSSTSGEQTPSNPFTPGIPSKDQTGNLQGQRGQSSKENIQQGRVEDKPLASLRDIKDVRDITGMSAEDAMNLAKNDPWIGSIFGKSDDVTLMQRIFMLPHWVAKRFPGFKAVYDRQVRRQDERAAGGARAYIDGAQKQIVNQYARRFTGDKGKGLSEEEARLIQDLYGDALITDAYMEEVRGQVTGGPSTRLWNKLMKVMGYPMSVAERFNRGSLALAAFRAARDGKMKAAARKRYGVEGEKATYEQAKAFAEEIVRDSHFVYGKTNAPELLRSSTAGRGLGAAFTFKTFTANLLGLWSWALRTQGKEGRIMVAKGLASTIALGGLVSTPFYATVMALVQAVSGDDDDWTEAIRKQLPQNTMLRDIVCYGLPAGAGVNLGGSLKMVLALTGGMQKGGTPKEVLTEGIGDIIGIPWDMFVERPSKVMEAMRADNYWRAVEEVVPTAVSNGMKAWRLATEGQKTLKGRDINDPGEQGARKLSSGEAFGKLLGFQPVSATRSYDAYTASKHSDSVRADKADEVATIMVKALDAGDSAEMVRARKVLKDWNLKMEEEGKPHMRILMKDVQKRVTQRRRKARMTPKARQKGEAFQSVWG